MDFNLSEEQLEFRNTARQFAEKELKPVAAELDKMDDPVARCPWHLMEKAGDLGLTKLLQPEKFGGLGRGVLDTAIVVEELAAADQGFAAMTLLANVNARLLLGAATPEQAERIAKDINSKSAFVFASGVTEPDRGGAEGLSAFPDPKIGLRTLAKREGDHYVINGQKGGFCTNTGPRVDTYLIVARTDLDRPQAETLNFFYVPANTPGLSIGPQTSKIGWRTVNHAQIFLDNVKVPLDARIGGEQSAGASTFGGSFLCLGPLVGSLAVGLARAAFEFAVQYTKQRVTWGQPIINHQAVALTLADMEMKLAAARHMVHHAAWMVDAHRGVMHTRGMMAKVFCTEMAVEVCQKAQSLLGMYGLSTEFPVEKWVRDSLSGPIQDGHNTMWRLNIAAMLAAQ